MNFILRWLRRLSASDTAVRAVEQSLLDWKHEVDEAPGVLGAFASDFRMAVASGRLIGGVIRTDVVDALRRPWLGQMLLWLTPATVVLGIATFASFPQSTQVWWWGLPGAALPYAAVMTIARARRQPPALGLFAVIAVLSFTQVSVWNATQAVPKAWFAVWFLNIQWLVMPAFYILLADRIRREASHNRALLWCAAAWCAARAIQVQLYWYAGGVYRAQLGWIAVAVPAVLWLYFAWKQDRATIEASAEEVTV